MEGIYEFTLSSRCGGWNAHDRGPRRHSLRCGLCIVLPGQSRIRDRCHESAARTTVGRARARSLQHSFDLGRSLAGTADCQGWCNRRWDSWATDGRELRSFAVWDYQPVDTQTDTHRAVYYYGDDLRRGCCSRICSGSQAYTPTGCSYFGFIAAKCVSKRFFLTNCAERPASHPFGRRHARRAMCEGELRRLLDATIVAPTRDGLSGSERGMIYRIAVETGLWASELRSLTRSSFDLDGDPPAVTVRAAYSKRRREDILPLKLSTASLIARKIESEVNAAQGLPLFNLTEKTARMIRVDLRLARARWIRETMDRTERRKRRESDFLSYVGRDGRIVDFHALRHTFISNLARGGVHPKQAQDLARHSDINLTMTRYSHTVISDRAAALAALPDLNVKPAKNDRTSGKKVCTGFVPTRVSARRQVACSGTKGLEDKVIRKPRKTAGNGVSGVRGRRSTPLALTTPLWIRTRNLRFRRPMLYPIELAAQFRRIRWRNSTSY